MIPMTDIWMYLISFILDQRMASYAAKGKINAQGNIPGSLSDNLDHFAVEVNIKCNTPNTIKLAKPLCVNYT